MTSAAEKMIDALKLCPCCRIERERVDAPYIGVVQVSFPCGSAAQVDGDGMATVVLGCPYPMDDALYEIQQRLSGRGA